MIDKMRKWLKDTDFDEKYTFSDYGYIFFDYEKFINDILNVMEE